MITQKRILAALGLAAATAAFAGPALAACTVSPSSKWCVNRTSNYIDERDNGGNTVCCAAKSPPYPADYVQFDYYCEGPTGWDYMCSHYPACSQLSPSSPCYQAYCD